MGPDHQEMHWELSVFMYNDHWYGTTNVLASLDDRIDWNDYTGSINIALSIGTWIR